MVTIVSVLLKKRTVKNVLCCMADVNFSFFYIFPISSAFIENMKNLNFLFYAGTNWCQFVLKFSNWVLSFKQWAQPVEKDNEEM